MDLTPIFITLKLAFVTTVVLFFIGTPIALWLAFTQSRLKTLFEAIVALPLVLPPTVLGFYLLIAFSPSGIIGAPWQALGGSMLAFTFPGLVIGSVLYSLPFYVQPLQTTFENIGKTPLETAATLRTTPSASLFIVLFPLSRRGFITAMTLGFAHTLGEFGVVLMIGGNIPGQTKVLSISIYDHVEALEYAQAHALSAGLLLFSFITLLLVYTFNRRFTHPSHQVN